MVTKCHRKVWVVSIWRIHSNASSSTVSTFPDSMHPFVASCRVAQITFLSGKNVSHGTMCVITWSHHNMWAVGTAFDGEDDTDDASVCWLCCNQLASSLNAMHDPSFQC
mmetsp:Transcript_27305/g.43504  ORF Transcript_27305/g.43504 Transcript_27305/m.43504 type:complete len:109 (+) Transcript_27305:422-748(+)